MSDGVFFVIKRTEGGKAELLSLTLLLRQKFNGTLASGFKIVNVHQVSSLARFSICAGVKHGHHVSASGFKF
jgi:hypothetical protein